MSEADFVSGGGEVLSPAQKLEAANQLARALLIRLGGKVWLDTDEVNRAALGVLEDGELVADKVNEYGLIHVYFRPWRTDA